MYRSVAAHIGRVTLRVLPLIVLAASLVPAIGCSESSDKPTASLSAAPTTWPVVGRWEAARFKQALPGLLVVNEKRRRHDLVVVATDGVTRTKVWSSSFPHAFNVCDYDPTSGQVLVELGPWGDFSDDPTVTLEVLASDGTVRRVFEKVNTPRGGDIWYAALMADGAVIWSVFPDDGDRRRLFFCRSGETPRRLHVSGSLPAGFKLAEIVPLAGHRTLALQGQTKTVLADWKDGALTVRGRPYRTSGLMHASTKRDTLLFFSRRDATTCDFMEVTWRDGRPSVHVILRRGPGLPSLGFGENKADPSIGTGPDGSCLVDGFWDGEVVNGVRLTRTMDPSGLPLLRVSD